MKIPTPYNTLGAPEGEVALVLPIMTSATTWREDLSPSCGMIVQREDYHTENPWRMFDGNDGTSVGFLNGWAYKFSASLLKLNEPEAPFIARVTKIRAYLNTDVSTVSLKATINGTAHSIPLEYGKWAESDLINEDCSAISFTVDTGGTYWPQIREIEIEGKIIS